MTRLEHAQLTGDHGTAQQAMEWALFECTDTADEFLRSWWDGDSAEWPEYYDWLAEREGYLSALNTPAVHAKRQEGDEYVCTKCRKRWDVHEDAPPCEA